MTLEKEEERPLPLPPPPPFRSLVPPRPALLSSLVGVMENAATATEAVLKVTAAVITAILRSALGTAAPPVDRGGGGGR